MRLSIGIFLFLATIILPSTISAQTLSPFAAEQQQAEALVEHLPIAQVLGPLAPVALSPFFGLTLLSGMSLLQDQGVLPDNLLLQQHPMLNDARFFGLLLLLTLLTSLPKLFTLSKFVAQAADQVEAYSGLVLFLLVIFLAKSAQDTPEPAVVQAGMLEFGQSTLLAIACVVQFVLINTVKYCFELLALITPVPLVDAALELTNKALVLALALLYAYNPYIALLPGLFLLLISAILFRWARRRMIYYKTLLIDPLWKSTWSRLRGKPLHEIPLVHRNRISHALGERLSFVAKAFSDTPVDIARRKELAYVAVSPSGVYLLRIPCLRPPRILPLRDATLEVKPGLLIHRLIVRPHAARPFELSLSRYTDPALLAHETHAPLSPRIARAEPDPSRSISKQVLRGELAN